MLTILDEFKPAYPESSLGGYAFGMILMLTNSISSPSVWLWLVVTAIAVLLLTGVAGRRRAGLVEALRAYVKRSQDVPVPKAMPAKDQKESDPAS